MIFQRRAGTPTEHIGRAKRLFEAVKYLQDFRTAFELAERFNIHIQTARLTLDALQQIGFNIEVKHGGRRTRFRINNTSEFFSSEIDNKTHD